MTSSPEGRQEAAVKPLEWGEHPIPPTGECLASTAVGLYCIPLGRKLFALRFRDKDTLREFDTLEAAKAAAQADFEARIRSALIPAKPAVEVVEALRNAYEKGRSQWIPASILADTARTERDWLKVRDDLLAAIQAPATPDAQTEVEK